MREKYIEKYVRKIFLLSLIMYVINSKILLALLPIFPWSSWVIRLVQIEICIDSVASSAVISNSANPYLFLIQINTSNIYSTFT